MRALWRLTGWSAAATSPVAVLAITSQTDTGSERLKLAFAPRELPLRPVPVVKIPPARRAEDAEIARLQTQVRMLTADRDRLTERVACLEHTLDGLNGSIKRQTAAMRVAIAPPSAIRSSWRASRFSEKP